MAVDFNAAPSPEGLELVAQLRRERLQRDKALEDRIAEAEIRELEAAGRASEASVAAGQLLPEEDVEVEVVEDDPVIAPAADAIERRAPERETTLSLKAQVEALASHSRPRQTDRQR